MCSIYSSQYSEIRADIKFDGSPKIDHYSDFVLGHPLIYRSKAYVICYIYIPKCLDNMQNVQILCRISVDKKIDEVMKCLKVGITRRSNEINDVKRGGVVKEQAQMNRSCMNTGLDRLLLGCENFLPCLVWVVLSKTATPFSRFLY